MEIIKDVNSFVVGRFYRIKIKGEEDVNAYVDALFLEKIDCDTPDEDNNSKTEEDEYIYGCSFIINDYSSYSLNIYPSDKIEIKVPIYFGTKLFVFDRIPPFDSWYMGDINNIHVHDASRVLFDNFSYFYRMRRTRCSRSTKVEIPIDAFEHLEFQEIDI